MTDVSHQSRSSERLLEAARQGDRNALGELTARYRSYLMAVANRTLGNGPPDECSSVVQEGIGKACEHFRRFRGATASELLGWLAAIVANEARDRRGAKRMALIP